MYSPWQSFARSFNCKSLITRAFSNLKSLICKTIILNYFAIKFCIILCVQTRRQFNWFSSFIVDYRHYTVVWSLTHVSKCTYAVYNSIELQLCSVILQRYRRKADNFTPVLSNLISCLAKINIRSLSSENPIYDISMRIRVIWTNAAKFSSTNYCYSK